MRFNLTIDIIGDEKGGLASPEGLVVDDVGNVYVCSSRHDCVKVYEASEQIKHLNLATACYRDNRYAEAIAEYQQVLRFSGDDDEVVSAMTEAPSPARKLLKR